MIYLPISEDDRGVASMAAGRFVVAALAVAGAAAGGLTGIGAPTAATVAPVNCATGGSASEENTETQDGGARRASSSLISVLDSAEADESRGRQANSGAAGGTSESSGESGTLASRARAGGDAVARSDDRGTPLGSAAELAQALAEALAGSTDPAARRIAAALADEGFVATERGVASDQDETTSEPDGTDGASGSASGRADATNDPGQSTRVGRSSGEVGDDSVGDGTGSGRAGCADPGAQREDTTGEDGGTGGRADTQRAASRTGFGDDGADDSADDRADDGADDRAIESIASVLERTATSDRTSTASGRGDDLRG
jgi:hypothetical protein